jgi:hypothetical protein
MSSSSRSVIPSSVLAVNPSSEMRATVDGRTPYPATRSSSSLGALAGGARGNGCGGGGGAACAGGPRSHRNGCAAEKASLGSMRGFCSTPLFLVLRFRCVRPDRGGWLYSGYCCARRTAGRAHPVDLTNATVTGWFHWAAQYCTTSVCTHFCGRGQLMWWGASRERAMAMHRRRENDLSCRKLRWGFDGLDSANVLHKKKTHGGPMVQYTRRMV